MCIPLLQIMCTLKSNYLPPSWVLNSEVECLPGFVAGRCWPSPPGFYHAQPPSHIHPSPHATVLSLGIPVNFPSISFPTSESHCRSSHTPSSLSATEYSYFNPTCPVSFFFSNFPQLGWHIYALVDTTEPFKYYVLFCFYTYCLFT